MRLVHHAMPSLMAEHRWARWLMIGALAAVGVTIIALLLLLTQFEFVHHAHG